MSFLIPVVAGAAVFLLLRWLLSRPQGTVPLDHPNKRSLHSAPVPRVGGVAICAVALPVLAFFWSPAIALIAVALAILSYLDDRGGLPVPVRFAGHIAAAVLLVLTVETALHWAVLALIALAAAWMINLYNFMDGSDGLAGGMALIGFGAYSAAASRAGIEPIALASATIAACAAAFLYFNWHPARIFMGDAGSIPLGFLAAAIGFAGWEANAWPWWFPPLVFSPFIVDATVTLLRRMLNGERFWAAHRSHYYQRLVQLGWGHRKTAQAELALMLACAVIGLGTIGSPPQTHVIVLVIMGTLYALLGLTIGRLWKNYVAINETP